MNISLIRQLSGYIILGAGLAVFPHMAAAQEQRPVKDLAEVHYLRLEYRKAAIYLEEASGKKNFKTAQLRMLADCYRQLNEYSKAVACYKKITDSKDAQPADFLHYGDAVKSMGDYAAARAIYASYADKGGAEAQVRMAGCDSAIQWMKEGIVEVRNMTDLNSVASDWGATWDGDGCFVFTSDSLRETMLPTRQKSSLKEYRRTGNAYQKLYYVDTVNGANGATMVFGYDASLNRFKHHAGPVAFSPDGATAFITVNDPGKPLLQREGSNGKYRTRRLELFVSARGQNGWQAPVPFAYNNPQYSVGHAAVSANGQQLYFTSDMPGGAGKTDIWFCEKQADGSWGTPQNCGSAVNTTDEEAFPTINESGKLYFASKGHPGMGGFDIFTAEGQGAQWQTPVNLKVGYNSPGDDFYLRRGPSGMEVFASNRAGGVGDDDLYRTLGVNPTTGKSTPGRKVFILEATVLGQGSMTPAAGAMVALTDENREAHWTLTTSDDGKVYMVILDGHRYAIAASGPGHSWSKGARFTAGGEDTVRVSLELMASVPRLGEIRQLTSILYDRDDYGLRPESLPVLDSLAELMEEYPAMEVELGAHTDSRHTDAYNIILSERRAASAANYLVSKGISRSRIQTAGYGEARLLNKCADGVECTEEEHQANRRTEVRVLKR